MPAYGAPGGYPQPGPPKKSKTVPIIIGIVAVVAIVIATCGIGAFLLSDSGDDTDTAAQPSPAPSNTAAASAAPTTAAPSAAPSRGAASVDTSRPEIAPAGAPYNFRVPTSFQEITPPKSDTTGSAAKYTSAAATSSSETNDFLIVDAYRLGANADEVTVSALETEFDRLVRTAGQDATTRETTTINGYRALKYDFKYSTSQAYSYFIFSGYNEIQVRCQWADDQSTIQKGCTDLLSSLTLT
jgi:hypothetical protein